MVFSEAKLFPEQNCITINKFIENILELPFGLKKI